MKILHCPADIGGAPGILARAQRSLGYDATSYVVHRNYLDLQADIRINPRSPTGALVAVANAVKFSLKYNVFHFGCGMSLTGELRADVPFLSAMGKKLFFHFFGCDIRDGEYTKSTYPISFCAYCTQMDYCKKAKIKKRFDIAKKYGHAIFVSTPDLLEFAPGAVLIPQPMDMEYINNLRASFKKKEAAKSFTIAHAPTRREIKGTSFLIDAVERLKEKGYAIELKLIENMKHIDAIHEYMSADLAVDHLVAGIYCRVTAEMMALGVPTIVNIRDDLAQHYQYPPPIINANPHNIESVIADVYENRSSLKELTQNGVDYVADVHDSMKIAKKLIEFYER